MICPKCKELGQKSTMYLGQGFSTCAGYMSYYDEEGIYHSHDGNTHTQYYSCSAGHRITISSIMKCPNCHWGLGNEKITVQDTEPLTITSNFGIIKIKND